MTLPSERYRALAQLPHVLLGLAAPGRTTKRELRRTILALLHHYPLPSELERMARRCPDLLSRE
jgi:hypothetical protein